MNKNRALKIIQEYQRRQPVDLLQDSFKEQTDFINDPAKRKCALTCRRSGKSFAAGLMMFNFCLKNNHAVCAYIGLYRDTAINVIIPILKKINRRFNCGAKFLKSPHKVEFTNGSQILFFGINDTEEEREKVLGQHYKLVVIDEGASYTVDLKAAIEEFIEPTLWDDNGQLVIIGTPGNLRNYFCDITEGRVPGWSTHFWLADKNPHTKEAYLREIADKRKLYPQIDQDTGFQQHYLGKWTVDTEKILYKYSQSNLIKEFKPTFKEPYTYMLAMDIGWNDANSFVVGAYHQYDKQLYFLKTFSKSEMLMDEITKKIEELESEFKISVYVIDSAEKNYIEELRYRTRRPFQAAVKPEKMNYISMMNSDLLLNKIKIVEPNCQSLLKEYDLLTKLEESHLYQKAVGNQQDHNADAALYLWRASYHYNHTNEPVKPHYSTEKAIDHWWSEEEEKTAKEKELPFWEK